MNICVLGLGKLGLPIAAVFADAGHNVYGYDKSKELIKNLKDQTFRSVETNLNNYLEKNISNLNFTSDLKEFSQESIEIFLVVVPTPSLPDGNFSNQLVMEAVREVIREFEHTLTKSLICITSTVMPGTCEMIISEILQKEVKEVQNFELVYHPEFIALGTVIDNLHYPDFLLIGSRSDWAAEKFSKLLKSVVKEETPAKILNLKEAELVKIAINNFVTMKISFANSIMHVADYLGGINLNQITRSIGMDSRIGASYLSASLPFGGPCFPRDTKAMSNLFREAKVPYYLSETVDKINTFHLSYLIQKIVNSVTSDTKIGVLGLSYKAGSDVIEESPGLKISLALKDLGYSVSTWDDMGASIEYLGVTSLELKELITVADILIVTREMSWINREYEDLINSGKAIIDLWNLDS